MEVCLLSHEVMLQPLSVPITGSAFALSLIHISLETIFLNWTFAAEERTKKNGEQSYFALEYATDTKIIRFKKIVSNANPFDERWNGYYEERDGEKMLNSTCLLYTSNS